MQRQLKIIVEKHADGYVAYPVGMKGVVVAQGDTYEAALTDVRSAIDFHIETFGAGAMDLDDMAQEVFVAEAGVSV
jgi:predicted RNase H-like HicB family nuclease